MYTDREKVKWCIEQHESTNHMYGGYLPYRFHLELTHNVFLDFKHLLDDKDEYYGNDKLGFRDEPETLRDVCYIACWGHNLIKDARVTFNDVKNVLGHAVADVVYALTNEKGRDRAEKGNEKYYEGIRATKGADFVKLCSRIANVKFSLITRSRMFKTYQEENDKFIEHIGNNYPEMNEYLIKLLNAEF